jgi:hypothetical protein
MPFFFIHASNCIGKGCKYKHGGELLAAALCSMALAKRHCEIVPQPCVRNKRIKIGDALVMGGPQRRPQAP